MNQKLTIVGPEASGMEDDFGKKSRVHIESLLLMAKYDSLFYQNLFENRGRALDESGIAFTPAEKALLTHISDTKLRQAIAEFQVPGIHPKSLPDWRKAAAVLLLVSSTMLSMPTCSSMFVANQTKSGPENTIAEGWIDDHTYRITAWGVPRQNEKDVVRRKIQAKDSAILMAQKSIIEMFKGIPLQGAGAAADSELIGLAVVKNFGPIIKNGKIIRENMTRNKVVRLSMKCTIRN